MFELTNEAISAVASFLSMLCWLGAQLPQTITNYKLQSVDGLSLPFLFNWLAGDTCNVVGCILTNQLPFQTILASYFTFVDATLLGQYFYYGRKDRRASLIASTGGDEGDPLLGGAERRRSTSIARSYASTTTMSTTSRARGHPPTLTHFAPTSPAPPTSAFQKTDDTQDGIDEEVGGAMMASFYSERGSTSAPRTSVGHKPLNRKHVSWSRDRGRGSLALTSTDSGDVETIRPQERVEVDNEDDALQNGRGRERRRNRSSVSLGRRETASIVFLGVWTLFGIGFSNSGSSANVDSTRRFSSSHTGYVLPPSTPTSSQPQHPSSSTSTQPFILPQPHYLFFSHSFVSRSASPSESTMRDGPLTPQPPKDHKLNKQRLIGRISAWICTTFYVTCRLPQIWKNFMRKSTHGLNPLLFLFAFFGNFFYVISIVFAPQSRGPHAKEFLLEALPYLIGSGGVLTFDVIILGQTLMYAGRKPKMSSRMGHSISHGSSLSHGYVRVRGRSDSVVGYGRRPSETSGSAVDPAVEVGMGARATRDGGVEASRSPTRSVSKIGV